jgi:hypothetical protein
VNRRIVKAVGVALAGMLLIHAVLFWRTRERTRQGYSDFTIFYAAGLMVRQGLVHRLYDDALQFQIQRSFASGVQIRQGPLPYNHPPFEALIFLPLTSLSYAAAYAVWNLINLAILLTVLFVLRPYIAILRYRPLWWWWLGTLAFFPVFVALLQGQDIILLLLLQALTYVSLKRNSDFLGGCWLGLGSFKFHLVLPLMLFLLAWKRKSAVLGFVLTCLGLGAVSIAIVGWPEATQYPHYVLHLEKIMGRGAIVPADMPNLRGLIEGWSVSHALPGVAHLLTAVSSTTLLLWVIMKGRRHGDGSDFDLKFSAAIVATLLVSYHSFAYDLTLLILPILLIINHWSETRCLGLRRSIVLQVSTALFFLTPLYMLVWFRGEHLNIFAMVLMGLLWGIYEEISIAETALPDRPLRGEALTPTPIS